MGRTPIVKWYHQRCRAHAETMADRAGFLLANAVIRLASESMREPKSGELYLGRLTKSEKSGKYKRRHKQVRSSAPGEAPAVQTGALRKSLTYARRIIDRAYVVGSNLKYAAHLEYGTRNMAARPYLRPAIYRVFSNVPKYLRKSLGGFR